MTEAIEQKKTILPSYSADTTNEECEPGLVSIVIPCYNAEKYVAEAIKSALNQTWPDTEIIVVDDGSTDASLKVIKSFGSSIRWRTGPNEGGCRARNHGLALAKGEWIQFLDADDCLCSSCIEDKLKTPMGENEIVCSKPGLIPGYDKALLTEHWLHAHYDIRTLVCIGTPQTSAPLHRKSNLKRIGGFRPNLPCSQEYDLHLRLVFFLGLSFKIIDSVGFLIRPLENSLSRGKIDNIRFVRKNVLSNLLEFQHQWKLPIAGNEEIIKGALLTIAKGLWRTGHIEHAKKLLCEEDLYSPKLVKYAYGNSSASFLAKIIGFRYYETIRRVIKKDLPE